jgi:HD-GYP domain-containing protein (c-di-GMP phosphodiesterase class II)
MTFHPFHPGIRGKMIALIALPTLVIYLGVLGLMFTRLIALNHQDVERTMTERAGNYADRFDAAFEKAATIAMTTARMMESAPDVAADAIFSQLRSNVLQDDAIYGAAMAFEPGTFRPGGELYAPYVYRSGDSLKTMNITRDVYDWHADEQWQWWHRSKTSGKPSWTEPYFDKGAGNVLMVTFSAPFQRDGKFRGITTVDIQIPKIRERVGAAIVGNLEFMILTRDGRFVYTRRQSDVMAERSVFDIMQSANRHDIADAFRNGVSGKAGVARFSAWEGDPPPGWKSLTRRSWLFYAPINSTGWTFAALVPESVALATVRSRMLEAGFALAGTLAMIIACIFIAGTRFTRPIMRMAMAVRQIASGDLEHRVTIASRDELGALGRDINTMATELKDYTERTARTRSRSREAMIFALAKLAESRDDDTGKHLERICRYVEILAAEVARSDPALDAEWIRTVSVTAALHDIGKVGIPDSVLKKRGKLTDDERKVMQAHTTIGGDTLIAVRREWSEDDFLRMAAEIALSHHERWDGTGYPFGLAADDISLAARIVAVADVYDALTSKRVYKDAMPHDQAMKIILEGSGRHFDPSVIDAFRRVQHEFQQTAEASREG